MPAATDPSGAIPESLDVATTAFFLDFDGTLAEIVRDPNKAAPTRETRTLLARLVESTEGAVAIVSGRSIAMLDEKLAPLRLPAAGVHGIERRTSDGTMMRAHYDPDDLARVAAETSAFAQARPGLLMERKPGSVALHYRSRPALREECIAFAAARGEALPEIRLLEGKMVIEMAFGRRDKGQAIAAFMEEKPFAGRLPVFIGDDRTDEAGFAVVNALGGITIKIGTGDTLARFRLPDVPAMTAWLRSASGAVRQKAQAARSDSVQQ